MHKGVNGLVLLIAGAGCAVRTSSYHLQDHVLIPPGVRDAGLTRRSFSTNISAGRGPCLPDESGIGIERKRANVRVTVTQSALRNRPPGWLNTWTAAAESRGCVAPGAGLQLAARIVESLPLDPNAAYSLLHANDRLSGYVDLGPENRIEVVSPILREGPAVLESSKISGGNTSLTVEVKSSANLLGYEIAYYEIRPKADFGFTVTPISAERHIGGKTEPRPRPATDYFRFPPQAAFYRLFYKADRSATVLAAPTRAELDRNTQTFQADPEICGRPAGPLCAVIPKGVAVNPDVFVMVNGIRTAVPVGSTVGSAIGAAEENPEAALPRLTVRKPYGGKPAPVDFNPASKAILGLMLNGGEQISWR